MKFLQRNFYLISFAVLAIFISIILIFREKDPGIPPLKERLGAMALGAEWQNTRESIEALTYNIRKNPDDIKSKIQLAQVYIQEGRITGDYNYYDEAAMKLLKEVLKDDPENFEALCSLATVYLSQHHFKEGLEVGLKAQQVNPHAAFVYGILTDAYVELGQYGHAVRMADSMCAIRPDLRSYSRISYMREIHGDIEGAKDVMKSAVKAGIPGSEQTEWCRIQIAKLYELTGNIDTAQWTYEAANTLRPNYAYALAGLGRVEKAKKNHPEAIKYFLMAESLVKDYSFGDELIDLYKITGQNEKADSTYKAVIALLNEHANTHDEDKDAGHYADKELAYVHLKMNEHDLALKHAEAEYNRRPDNIEVNELMAWVHYKKGNISEAMPYTEKALRTGSANPELLCRAGLIYCKSNQTEKGSALIAQAIEQNPFLAEELLADARPYLSDQAVLASK